MGVSAEPSIIPATPFPVAPNWRIEFPTYLVKVSTKRGQDSWIHPKTTIVPKT
jgi:hypothetical protein